MKRTVLEIALTAANLGLLRRNEIELAKLEGYAKCWEHHHDGEMKITDNQVLARLCVEPGKFGPWADITFSTLVDIYEGDSEPEWVWEAYLEDDFYHIYNEEEE